MTRPDGTTSPAGVGPRPDGTPNPGGPTRQDGTGRPDTAPRPDGTRPDPTTPRPDGARPDPAPRPDGRTPKPDGPARDGSTPGNRTPDPQGTRPTGSRPETGAPHDPKGPRPDGSAPKDSGPDGPEHRPDTDPHRDGDAEPGTPERQQQIDEAEAHRDTTPGGSSFHTDPNMRDLAQRVPDDGVHHTVDVHALPDGRVRIGDRTFSPQEFADMLRRDPNWDGKPIRLLSCDAGTSGLARDLSRELGVPVTAPRGLAWTDGSGRVFASDMGPDGRPGWPPNGGWDTHNPDGTRTPASNDGFHPTRDGEDPGQRPDEAEARGDEDAQGNDDARSEAQKRLIDRLNELHRSGDAEAFRDLFEKYYVEHKTGHIHRRVGWETNPDLHFDEHPVPPLRYNSDTQTFDRPSDAIDNFASWEPLERPDPSKLDQATYDDFVERRRAAITELENAKEHDKQFAQQKDENGKVIKERDTSPEADESAEALRKAHANVTDIGEEFGEQAARDSLINDYGVPPENITVLHNSGVFDLVGELPDGRFVVIEAKGPSADLGSRIDLSGKRSQQGTREYFESIVDNMMTRGEKMTDAEYATRLRLAARLSTALALDEADAPPPGSDASAPPRRVRYDVVKPIVEPIIENGEVVGEKANGYDRKRFDLGTGRNEADE